MTTFREGQDVAVVECDFSTGEPLKDGEVHAGTVVYAREDQVHVRFGEDLGVPLGRGDVFWDAPNGCRVHGDEPDWRVFALCRHCHEPITSTPVTDEDDPLGRVFCTSDCRDDEATGWE